MDPSSQEKKYLKIIVDEVERLEKILRDLLIFSRGPHLEPRKISIPPLLEKSIDMHREEIREKKIRVVREFGEHLPELIGDEEQLGQALSNMISNAEQAMTSGGVLTVRAYSRTEDEAMNIYVEIQDTGKGIPEENLDLIFNPFFSTKHAGEGTGLGLSVSRRIVEEHNGRINVESTVGKGSTFSIVLPLHPKEEHTVRPREENQE
jgi:signal transduction histidine kinase